MKSIRSTTLLLALSGFLLLFGNFRFFSNVLQTYPLNGENLLFLLSLALVFGCINLMILTLLSVKYLIKPALILLLLASASAAYFMDSYNVIIDDVMVGNLLKTDMRIG